ncbi:ABC transporter permease [Pseudobdellovibrio exovorus]|uniref:Sugar ABC transporter, permease protein n=1 Tax=Pseudobdellovibrio exovorus JSS TaxID=1184267 RepID=M4V9M6_9BACT|nr:ABC transporter permease [Pseudobdellovibrio exovorus]AGH94731.1 sugar ABC transporter, permease protein [Pseudobdellovibrio exovorus JSS]
MDSVYLLLLLSTLRLSLPLFFAATGAYFSEKAGVAQIALESYLLIGAFSAASVAYFSGSVLVGYLAAAVITAVFAQIFCLLILKFKANSIVVGTGMNLLAMGIIPIVSKTLFNSTGSTPSLAAPTYNVYLPYFVLAVTIGLSYWLSEKTIWGLQMKFAGEKKLALESVGVSIIRRQWQSLTLSAFVTGLGGAVLSTALSSNYSPMMSSGRGFIALAAVIFAGWHLNRAYIVCLFFGFCEALQILLQSNAAVSQYIAAEFIQMIPYLATLLALLLLKSRFHPPAELR